MTRAPGADELAAPLDAMLGDRSAHLDATVRQLGAAVPEAEPLEAAGR